MTCNHDHTHLIVFRAATNFEVGYYTYMYTSYTEIRVQLLVE